MSASPALHEDVHAATAALHARLDDVRSKVPPPVRAAFLPDSTSTVLRNLAISTAALAAFLLLGSLFASETRFLGNAVLLVAAASCVHAAGLALVLGSHLCDAAASLGLHHLAAALRAGGARRGSDPFALGALFGSTVAMAVAMQVVHSVCGGMAKCVTNEARKRVHGGGFNSSYDPMDGGAYDGTWTPAQHYMAKCGATTSASVGFVSFVAGWLFWIHLASAAVLYAKRQELLSGDAAVGSSSQYDEIGAVNSVNSNGGFAGDFPTASGVRTMHV